MKKVIIIATAVLLAGVAPLAYAANVSNKDHHENQANAHQEKKIEKAEHHNDEHHDGKKHHHKKHHHKKHHHNEHHNDGTEE